MASTNTTKTGTQKIRILLYIHIHLAFIRLIITGLALLYWTGSVHSHWAASLQRRSAPSLCFYYGSWFRLLVIVINAPHARCGGRRASIPALVVAAAPSQPHPDNSRALGVAGLASQLQPEHSSCSQVGHQLRAPQAQQCGGRVGGAAHGGHVTRQVGFGSWVRTGQPSNASDRCRVVEPVDGHLLRDEDNDALLRHTNSMPMMCFSGQTWCRGGAATMMSMLSASPPATTSVASRAMLLVVKLSLAGSLASQYNKYTTVHLFGLHRLIAGAAPRWSRRCPPPPSLPLGWISMVVRPVMADVLVDEVSDSDLI
jgi:hypothetical protein